MRFGEQRFQVELSRKAKRYYEQVNADTAARLDKAFEEMEQDPWSGDTQAVKGEQGTWRRVGEWGVILRFDRK